MSVNINVEDMPQSAQTAYARKNKLRGITMKICWALTPVLFVIFCIMSLVNKTFSEDIEFDLEVALTLGCGLLQASNSGGIRQDRGTGNSDRFVCADPVGGRTDRCTGIWHHVWVCL